MRLLLKADLKIIRQQNDDIENWKRKLQEEQLLASYILRFLWIEAFFQKEDSKVSIEGGQLSSAEEGKSEGDRKGDDPRGLLLELAKLGKEQGSLTSSKVGCWVMWSKSWNTECKQPKEAGEWQGKRKMADWSTGEWGDET